MLPLKLSIEGLYSYQKKQTIDFTALTEAGLFGIFGAVGSGKSSVLEAIGFVLYGETERLNSRDKRAYNMLNLKSLKAEIDFEFLNYEERKFKYTASWGRNKQKFEDVSTITRSAYEWLDNKWIPLTSVDATEIIGLSYDNFRRTIIIPQGKFKEFLDLKGKDRSDMMKEIFHLQKFDLSVKVSHLQAANKSSLDQLKGALSGFETISVETILSKEEEWQIASKVLETNKEVQKKADEELAALNTLKTNFEDLENRKTVFSALNVEKPKMDALQAEITEYEKVEKVFGANLLTLSQSTTALANAKADFSITENSFKTIQETIETNENALLVLQPKFDNLEAYRNKVSDLESIAKVLNLKIKNKSFQSDIEKGNDLIIALTAKELEEKNKLETVQKEISELKSKKTDTSILLAVGKWFLRNRAFQNSIDDTITNIKNTSEKILSAKDSYKTLGLSITSWAADLEAKSGILETTKKELEASKNKLLVAKELAQFSHNLHDGESCPLCGALEHPNPMQVVDVSKEIEAIDLQILEVDKQEKVIRETKALAQKNQISLSHLEGQLLLSQTAKEQFEKDQKSHLQTFIWKEFSSTNFDAFEQQQQVQEQLDLNIKAAESNEKTVRNDIDTVADDLKIHTANQSKIKSDMAAVTGAIDNELSQLKVISFQEYQNKVVVLIQSEKTTLEAENNRIASEFKSKSDEIDTAKKIAAELKGRLTTQKEVVDKNERTFKDTQIRINDLLIKHQFDSIESVTVILSKSFDTSTENEKIKQFAIDLETAKKLVIESEKLVAGQQFDIVLYEIKEKEATTAKEAVDTQLGVVATFESDLKKMREELEKKADLLSQYAVLESRAANLTTLNNMFNGSGFVNYVSSIYLQNLADVANVRFHRMTKNQLSLQINVSNEFEVIDYLNNGASRSVKTLSGGQGFQASLCLALALAESVQSLNKNNKNFFFIDEGFGTQDPDSVAVVFETLQSLYKENRIVGIISHVTELQERIPRSINVVKDEERGSEINENWN
jgi:exonuclease SbcC